jgi:hypothetical protein
MTPPKWTRESTECRPGGRGGFLGAVGEAPEWAIPEGVPPKDILSGSNDAQRLLSGCKKPLGLAERGLNQYNEAVPSPLVGGGC